MKTKRHQVRQGDVLLTTTDRPSSSAQRQPVGKEIVLAQGEATGHHHTLDIDTADWWKADGEQFVATKFAAPVRHQEHAPAKLKAKRVYRVVTQREYHPLSIRNVAD